MIDLLIPEIFPKHKIISGVTKVNYQIYSDTGLSLSSGEILSIEQLEDHRNRFASLLNYNLKDIKFQKQIHGDTIRIIDSSSLIEESDGMITTEKGLILSISIADCAAVLVYDKENEVIGAAHSGWKGTHLNISSKLINLLKVNYHSNPSDLLVYLSPCAGAEKYEVSWDIAQHFPNSIKQISDEKYLFNNSHAIKLQLLDCGIDINNIEISDVCTISNLEYHSYRRDKSKSGRMSAFIGMK